MSSSRKLMFTDLDPNYATNQIEYTRKFLKKQMIWAKPKFSHHVKEQVCVLNLIEHTIESGESNSLLLVGPRGSGKSALVVSALSELSEKNTIDGSILTVYLHGLFHTDNRLALIDITSQLQLEIGNKMHGSFTENLTYLLDCLKIGNKKKSRPVVFILDEFDQFCAHNSQTLLYNLFDVAQADQSPICVIGLTSRIDVIELLEKRVKSRFSHRQIFILPQSMEEPEQIRQLHGSMNIVQEFLGISHALYHQKNENLFENFRPRTEFTEIWNTYVSELSQDHQMQEILQGFHRCDHSHRNFRNFITIAITLLSEDKPRLEFLDFHHAQSMLKQDQKILILKGLSVLEFCVITAIMHETHGFIEQPINFETIYNRYILFANHSAIEFVQKPVVLKAFEHLQNLELIMQVAGSNHRTYKECQYYNFMLTKGQVKEAVRIHGGLPTDVVNWALNEGIM